MNASSIASGSAFFCAVAVALTSARAGAQEPPSAPAQAAPSAPAQAAPSAPAQAAPLPQAPKKEKRPFLGGLGYGSFAPFFGGMSGLESLLSQPTALGASYDVPRAGVLLGGGGGAVLFGHLWVGGKGFALLAGTSETPKGGTSYGGGGGGFDVGYVIVPGPGSLLIPFFGYGGFGYRLDVENKGSAPIALSADAAIAPGETRTFRAGFATLEAGICFQRLVFFGGSAGMTAGFEAGLLASLAPGVWSDGSTALHDQASAHLTGGYVRMNLGGGGFWFR